MQTTPVLAVATAVPCTFTEKLVPGQVTSVQPTILLEPPTGMKIVAGTVMAPPLTQSTRAGTPVRSTFKSAWPVLKTVSENVTGPLAANVTGQPTGFSCPPVSVISQRTLIGR